MEKRHPTISVSRSRTRKDKLLSFAFVANSAEQLKKMTESMRNVQFF